MNTHNQQVIEGIPMVDNDEKLKETILTSAQKKVVNNVYTLYGNQLQSKKMIKKIKNRNNEK